jgi:hypothetical protein
MFSHRPPQLRQPLQPENLQRFPLIGVRWVPLVACKKHFRLVQRQVA